MSEGLEALKNIKINCCTFEEKTLYQTEFAIIEKELKRLAKIDDLLEEIGIDENDLPIWFEMQKQDGKKVNALEIIKEKNVDVRYLKVCFTDEFGNGCSAYNRWKQDNENNYLTEEEFNLLKEVLL